MSLFQRKTEEKKRSIEEILTPINDGENVRKSEENADSYEEEIMSEDKTDDEYISDFITTDEVAEEIAEEVKEAAGMKSESADEFTDNALNCFGWREAKTEKWLIRSAKIWYGIMSLIWFIFGAVTFAPMIFISNKVNVIFKNKKKSLFVGIGIYAALIAIIVIIIVTQNLPQIANS